MVGRDYTWREFIEAESTALSVQHAVHVRLIRLTIVNATLCSAKEPNLEVIQTGKSLTNTSLVPALPSSSSSARGDLRQ